MSRYNVVCYNCGQRFHYCSSCERDLDAEVNCCSSKCAGELVDKLEGEELIKFLVKCLRIENLSEKSIVSTIEEYKVELGKRLIDDILEDNK